MTNTRVRFSDNFRLCWHLVLILSGVTGVGVIANRLFRIWGVQAMPVRYPLVVLCGYAAFFVFLRLWLAYIHHRCGGEPSRLDFTAAAPATARPPRAESSPGGWNTASDFVEMAFEPEGCLLFLTIVTVVVLIAGGWALLAEAPALLSETAASFFLAGSLARPLREIRSPGWTGGVLRRTFWRFAVVFLFALGLGLVLHFFFPGAHSIPEALRQAFG